MFKNKMAHVAAAKNVIVKTRSGIETLVGRRFEQESAPGTRSTWRNNAKGAANIMHGTPKGLSLKSTLVGLAFARLTVFTRPSISKPNMNAKTVDVSIAIADLGPNTIEIM